MGIGERLGDLGGVWGDKHIGEGVGSRGGVSWRRGNWG